MLSGGGENERAPLGKAEIKKGGKKVSVTPILTALEERFPTAECELNHRNPFELLVATILSAQCTDQRVNRITPTLFARFPSASALAAAPREELEKIIFSCGFYKNKANNLLRMAAMLTENYNGQVPADRDRLESLPGVGRKTANVVAAVAFSQDVMPVDTHVFRVSRRLGLAKGKTPDMVERELTERLPRGTLARAHHLLIWHGRRICHAKKPDCAHCPVSRWCEMYNTNLKNAKETL